MTRGIFSAIVALAFFCDPSDAVVAFIQHPRSTFLVSSGQAAKFPWNYTFDLITELDTISPTWDLYPSSGASITLAVEDERKGRVFTIASTCPARLKSRISKEGRATLVISNSTAADTGTYGCTVHLYGKSPIISKVNLIVTVRPKFTTRPTSNITITEGQVLNISCAAIGPPVPTVKLMFIDGQTKVVRSQGSGSAFLSIPNIRRDQNGTYQCEATNNPNETSVTTQTTIKVEYPPAITYKSQNTTVTQGEQIQLTCTADGDPVANIKWTKEEGSIKADATTNRSTLTISNARKEDIGRYICTASNSIGNVSSMVNVAVRYEPSIANASQHLTVNEGEPLSLICDVDGNPQPTIIWSKQPGNIGNVSTGSVYNISSVSRADAGNYTCTATNPIGSTLSTTQVSVYFAPVFTVHPQNITVKQGDVITMTAEVSSNPESSFTWRKDNNSIRAGILANTSTLYIPDAIRTDAGKYIVTAINTFAGGFHSKEASSFVFVKYPPSIISSSRDQTVYEGNPVTLKCSSDGYPSPNITWIRPSGSLIPFTGPILNITSANRSDTGTYTCLAINEIGNASASVKVNVYYVLSMVAVPQGATVTKGDNVTLTCLADANPKPTYTWTKTNGAIKPGAVTHSSTLVIYNVDKSDAGNYICTARSKNRTANASALVLVKYPPSIKSSSRDQTVYEGSPVTLKCSSDGYPSPNITWIRPSGSLIPFTGPILNITSANRSDTGTYTCFAINEIGSSSASIKVNVYYVLSMVVVPQGATVTKGDNLTLTCSADANPKPTYTWTKTNSVIKPGTVTHSSALVIYSVDKSDAGRYICTARSENRTANASALVLVKYPPAVTNTTPDQVINEGDPLILMCTITGYPPPVISWFKSPSSSPLPISGNVYNISSVSRSETGTYTCRGNNTVGYTSAAISVTVNFRVTLVSPMFQNVTINQGDTFNLTCAVSGHPAPVMSWSKEGGTVSSALSTNGSSLFISSALRHYSGVYMCTATNSYGSFNWTVTANYIVTVRYMPIITNTSGNRVYNEGDSTRFECTADGLPSAIVTWTRKPKPLLSYVTGNVLNDSSLDRTEDGIYTCTAENALGSASASMRVILLFPVNIAASPQNTSVTKGSVITLTCAIVGNPAPLVTWIKDRSIKRRQEIAMNTSTPHYSKLVIANADRGDAGIYTCTATNVFKGDNWTSTSNAAFVNVQYTSKINTSLTNITAYSWIGLEIRLQCVADGNPTPQITWYKPGGQRITSGVTAISGGSVVTVRTTQDGGDYGRYKCRAANSVGSDEHVINVIRLLPPGPPVISITNNDIKPTLLKVRWNSPVDNGGSPVIDYKVEVSAQPTREGITGTSVVISGLNKNTEYVVKVYARNVVGYGNPATKVVATKKQGPPALPKLKSISSEAKTLSVKLEWNRPDNNGGAIQKYTIYIKVIYKGEESSKSSWISIHIITDPRTLQYTVRYLQPGNTYKFLVTASNEFGESVKDESRARTVDVVPPETESSTRKSTEQVQACSCTLIIAVCSTIFAFLVLFVLILLAYIWRTRSNTANKEKEVIRTSSQAGNHDTDTIEMGNTNTAGEFRTPLSSSKESSVNDPEYDYIDPIINAPLKENEQEHPTDNTDAGSSPALSINSTSGIYYKALNKSTRIPQQIEPQEDIYKAPRRSDSRDIQKKQSEGSATNNDPYKSIHGHTFQFDTYSIPRGERETPI